MLYMAVTADRLELPIAVEDTAVKLAKKMGVNPSNIRDAVSKGLDGSRIGIKYVKVEVA